MTEEEFNPENIYCSEWKKINSRYLLREGDEKNNVMVCSECSSVGSLKRCGGCYEAAYCSTDHQRRHWKKEHRMKCCPYKIVQGNPETVGRYVVATRYFYYVFYVYHVLFILCIYMYIYIYMTNISKIGILKQARSS